jgi:tetratricopeptide (TPR) repeat protein
MRRHFGWSICVVALGFLCGLGPEIANAGANRETISFDELMKLGWAAQESGDVQAARMAFRAVATSNDSWYSWAGESALVATYRLSGDWDGARQETAQIAARRPDLVALMHLWDGDTAVLAGDLDQAVTLYREAETLGGAALVGNEPLGALALRQLARAELGRGDALAAAQAEREILHRYPEASSPEFTLATTLVYEAMAEGRLPLESLPELLHYGDCSAAKPCGVGRGFGTQREGSGRVLAALKGLSFELSIFDQMELEAALAARRDEREAKKTTLAILTCTPSAATAGFMYPLANTSPGGYVFMSTIPEGYHPGIDINTAAGDGDCGVSFKAVAQGCVTDSSPANWGSATIQHSYASRIWTSQYGHASSIAFSSGSAVTKGATLGQVGKVGADTCHLHHEIREQDHPAATNADYYSSLTQTNVGDWYQNPFPFEDAHRSYSTAPTWIDEESFVRTGTWTLVSGVGDEDDLRWGATTATGTKSTYSRYTFTPSTTGTYEIWTFVPWNYGTSTAVPYRLVNSSTGAAVFSKTVNQLSLVDAWIKIGSGSLTGGISYYIEVATNTGESSKKVALDDFLIIKP